MPTKKKAAKKARTRTKKDFDGMMVKQVMQKQVQMLISRPKATSSRRL